MHSILDFENFFPFKIQNFTFFATSDPRSRRSHDLAVKALKNMRNNLKKSGRLGISVHGHPDKVPFFNSIFDAVTQFIPDYVPPGTPDFDRFATKKLLKEEVNKVGFSKIIVMNKMLG